MRKGFIQIAFLPLLLAGFVSVVLIGLLGVVGNFVSSSLSKLVLLGSAIFLAYIVYKRISKKPVLDSLTIALIIGSVLLALFVLGSNNFLGLQSMLP